MAAMFFNEKMTAHCRSAAVCPSVRMIPEVSAAIWLVVSVLVCLRVLPCIL
jgi:hypothetical protein